MNRSPYGALTGECAVGASGNLEPGTGGSFGSGSASVHQWAPKLGNGLPGEHISLKLFRL